MQSTTLPVLTNMAPVTKSLLEQGGFKVDMQSMDWQTLVTRRTKKEPADKGGWNVFHTFSVSADALNPISNSYFAANGDKAWFGWPTDPEMEALRDAWFEASDLSAQQKICRDMQEQFWQNPLYVPLGMYDQPTGFRSSLQDVRDGWPQFYGVRRV